MERFAKIVNSWKPLSIFRKSSILDLWQCSKIFNSLFYVTPLTRVASYYRTHQTLWVRVVFLETPRNRKCGSYFKLLKEENRNRCSHMFAIYWKWTPPLQTSSNASKNICQETLQMQADQTRSDQIPCCVSVLKHCIIT